jgi:hypothetical protein
VSCCHVVWPELESDHSLHFVWELNKIRISILCKITQNYQWNNEIEISGGLPCQTAAKSREGLGGT